MGAFLSDYAGARTSRKGAQPMHMTLTWLSIGFSALSGALWFYAAFVEVPTNIESGFGKLVGVEEMRTGFKRQAQWNGHAAACTALAALLQAAAMTVS
jgi:hypothetical protein